MNKTVAFITFGALAGIALIGIIILSVLKPDAVGSLTTNITTILGLVTVAAGTLYGLGKQGEKLEVIKKQTNGTLSALTEENTRLTDIIIRRGIDPLTGEQTKPRAAVPAAVSFDATIQPIGDDPGRHSA
ncbi:MAG: hypothetical protein ABWY36_06260 [Leifsonia sp.]